MELLKRPSSDFAAVRDGRLSMPLYVDIDLGFSRSKAAGTALVLNIAGNRCYVDANPKSGDCQITFQDATSNRSSAGFYAQPGFIASVPFTSITIENLPQSANGQSKTMRLFYGVDLDFSPGSLANINLSGYVESAVGSGDYQTWSYGNAGTPNTSPMLTAVQNPTGGIVTCARATVIDTLASYALLANAGYPDIRAGTQKVISKIDNVTVSGANVRIELSLPNFIVLQPGEVLYLYGLIGSATGIAYSSSVSMRRF